MAAGLVLFVITLIVNALASVDRDPVALRRGDGDLMSNIECATTTRRPSAGRRRARRRAAADRDAGDRHPSRVALRRADAPTSARCRVRRSFCLDLAGLRAAHAAERRSRVLASAGTRCSSPSYAFVARDSARAARGTRPGRARRRRHRRASGCSSRSSLDRRLHVYRGYHALRSALLHPGPEHVGPDEQGHARRRRRTRSSARSSRSASRC